MQPTDESLSVFKCVQVISRAKGILRSIGMAESKRTLIIN